MLAAGVRWHDDWYAIEEIADGVFAIGEPRYHQINWNYLICGLESGIARSTPARGRPRHIAAGGTEP
jgi:hypothetical protein